MSQSEWIRATRERGSQSAQADEPLRNTDGIIDTTFLEERICRAQNVREGNAWARCLKIGCPGTSCRTNTSGGLGHRPGVTTPQRVRRAADLHLSCSTFHNAAENVLTMVRPQPDLPHLAYLWEQLWQVQERANRATLLQLAHSLWIRRVQVRTLAGQSKSRR